MCHLFILHTRLTDVRGSSELLAAVQAQACGGGV